MQFFLSVCNAGCGLEGPAPNPEHKERQMDSPEANRLIEKKESLIREFLDGKAENFLERLTTCLDEYFYSVFEKSIAAGKMVISGNPFAIIALGGYGRKEQCIHSDIDLLILFDKIVPPDVEAFVQELLYPLWDARFEVGYAVRNIDECIKMSFERFDILTTVLDARFICGASLIYSEFVEKFRKKLTARHLKPTLNYLYDNGLKRLEDFGDSTYLLTPDLKSGFGGLRDYHTLLWYAKIKSNIKSRRDLEYYGFLSNYEYHTLEKSLADIWQIRNFLHHISKQAEKTNKKAILKRMATNEFLFIIIIVINLKETGSRLQQQQILRKLLQYQLIHKTHKFHLTRFLLGPYLTPVFLIIFFYISLKAIKANLFYTTANMYDKQNTKYQTVQITINLFSGP